MAALPWKGRVLGVAFERHPRSPLRSQNRVEEAFLYRLGRMVQALGYTPLFIMDRSFDRVSRMKRLQEWGMGFLIRLRRNRQVAAAAGEVFRLGERYPQGPMHLQGVRLFGPRGWAVEVVLHRASGKQEPWGNGGLTNPATFARMKPNYSDINRHG